MGEEALAAERHELDEQARHISEVWHEEMFPETGADRVRIAHGDWTRQTDHRAVVSEIVAARRDHIRQRAKCVDCGWPRALCDSIQAAHEARHPDDKGPKGDFCTARPGMQGCRHRDSEKALAELFDEMLSGTVRTVAEVDPAPVQGPEMPRMSWLLEQTEWWYPKGRPAVRVAEMDKTYRYNTLKWLERRASTLHGTVGSRYMAEAPDEVWADWEQEAKNPVGWLHGQPLCRALRRGLPTGGRKLAELQERARHWSTCPMRLKREARLYGAVCTCIPRSVAEGGRATR